MTYYGKFKSKGKQAKYGGSSNNSNNRKRGKFSVSRNRHKKAIKSSERWGAKRLIVIELFFINCVQQ